MSIDVLQDKIRKRKNALIVDMTVLPEELPPFLIEREGNVRDAYAAFCRELLSALKGSVPAVRFSFTRFALLGDEGLFTLKNLLKTAAGEGYYVLLDAPEIGSPQMAQYMADCLFSEESGYACDGIVLSVYAGSDILKPFLPYCRDNKKDVFCIVRNANKSASEIQDLLSGTRLVHMAAAERISRLGEGISGKFGYSRVAVLAAASSAESMKSLRSKYPGLFILVDGLDYPSANMKNASFAFDKLGHGAVVCGGAMITCAWKDGEGAEEHFASEAVEAAERIKKNLSRYFSIL